MFLAKSILQSLKIRWCSLQNRPNNDLKEIRESSKLYAFAVENSNIYRMTPKN